MRSHHQMWCPDATTLTLVVRLVSKRRSRRRKVTPQWQKGKSTIPLNPAPPYIARSEPQIRERKFYSERGDYTFKCDHHLQTPQPRNYLQLRS